jgi:hypothetical protein
MRNDVVIYPHYMNHKQLSSWVHFCQELERRGFTDPLFKEEEFGRMCSKFGYGFIEYIRVSYVSWKENLNTITEEEFKKYNGIPQKYFDKLKQIHK